MKRRYQFPLLIVLCVAALLLVLHFSLAHLVKHYLNEKLADMGDYHGQVSDVDLRWWQGAYQIKGLVIEKKDGDVPVPLLDAPDTEISVSWHALWNEGAVVAEVIFHGLSISFVDTPGGDDQTGEGVDWREQLEKLLPITLDEVRVDHGRLAFRNFQSDPPVDVYVDAINAQVFNLTNTRDAQEARSASFKGEGRLLGQAPIEATAHFDPLVRMDNFDVQLRMTGLELTRLNDFANAYGRFDFHGGTGDLVTEVEVADSQISGYIKPLLKNVEIFNWDQDVKEKGFLRGMWEAVVGGGETVLKNQRKDQFATRIELSGTTKSTDVNAFSALISILRNAFVQAFTPRFEKALEDGDG
jgi:hypothetical protein